MNRRAATWLVLAVLGAACGDDRAEPARDAAPPAREVHLAGIEIGASGLSEPIEFEVPAQTRSLTIVVRGDGETLYALAALTTSDGVERVELPDSVDLPAAMYRAYNVEQVGAMPGAMYQSIRLGLFPHVYPNRPGDPLPAGTMSLRVAADTPGPVDVDLWLPEDDGADVLHLNVFAVSNERSYDTSDPSALPFLSELRRVMAAADIRLEVDAVINLPDSGLDRMTEFTEPQEPPSSMSSQLALLAGALVDGDGLNVFVVDAMPSGVGGWSLGTPGPPVPDTYYSGVVLRHIANNAELGRVAAHEIAHYVGLSHVINRGLSGAVYPDPLDDTEPGTGNLMDGGGTALSPDQSFVLSRSAMLELQ